ncbi:MAG TPA: HAMP domain-containing sensor histidine kinase [Polyangia bacterium]|jgi:signal transduction histidine kinase|nr:HAMP domain-containing sensor histidine kinase [Polyangia bacterium]
MSTLAAVLESVALAAALAFAIWAWRGRSAAAKRAVALQAQLGEERRSAERREGLLRTVVETTPVAMVLFGDAGDITFTNRSARDLFFEGMTVEGQNFLSMIERAPESLRRAVLSEGDELFSVDGVAGRETFHLSRRHLEDGQTLIAVRSVTQEINRHEVVNLKKVIRIISHEINNSLGPISSLIGSAKIILQRPEHLPRLSIVFDTIQERALHLQSFLDGYATLAKIPKPQPVSVAWGPFLDSLRGFWPGLEVADAPTRPGFFDSAQIQQVLINLVKNAHEAGGPPSEVKVVIETSAEGGCRISVQDRGPGISDEVMQNVFLPFFTTKPSGDGLGLALSREIVELHQGRLGFGRREGGGMSVSVWLPDRESGAAGALAASRARLTLTRA